MGGVPSPYPAHALFLCSFRQPSAPHSGSLARLNPDVPDLHKGTCDAQGSPAAAAASRAHSAAAAMPACSPSSRSTRK
ncbi:hypothetical protein WJX81_004363 [Elliptochloris bilobata]|uniref:Uncharacterized protein n=1 Tax=Elliptochloris bilobata TaxID=381761 RepID=A0AAW1QEC8_9CHLO